MSTLFIWPRGTLCSREGHSACRARWCLRDLYRTAYPNNMLSSLSLSNKHSHRSDKLNLNCPSLLESFNTATCRLFCWPAFCSDLVPDCGSVCFSLSGCPSLCSLNKIHCLHLSTTQWWFHSKVLLMWFRLPLVWLRILDPVLLLWLHLHRTVQLRLGLHLRYHILCSCARGICY